MAEDKGLYGIAVHLTPDQARIIAAHDQLKRALASIEIPKSGRWKTRETAIAVLDALDAYLCKTLDDERCSGGIIISHQSDQRAVLQDIIRHFDNGRWGNEDPRLAPHKSGAAGSAHDEAMKLFKLHALSLVNGVSLNLKLEGVKNHKAAARNKVVAEYRRLGLKFQNSAASEPEDIDATLLASWEKRHKSSNFLPRA